MTTSPPSQFQKEIKESTLGYERASSIGWFFIESYYDFYNKNIEQIHKIFHPDASISHMKFPSEADELRTVFKAHGGEAIKSRFDEDSTVQQKNNRIVISSADFEVCLSDKILIVVIGEWSKNDSPYWQFTQTFLLTPGKKENTFDVANDVLKFIDYEDFKDKTISIKHIKPEKKVERTSSSKTEQPKEKASNGTELKKSIPNGLKKEKPITDVSSNSEVSEIKAEAPTDSIMKNKEDTKEKEKEKEREQPVVGKVEPKPSQETHSSPVVAKSEPKPDIVNATSPESTAPKAEETSESDSDVEAHNEDAGGASDDNRSKSTLSWAALASQAAPTKSPAKVETPSPVAKPAVAPPKKAVPPPQQNIKYKKEDWFPIYIRGVRQLDEKRLKDHLVKKFGGIKFFKLNMNIAFCDFVSEESQKKALEAKQTVVDDITILLEPRESKNSNNNGNKKHKDMKEKQNGDVKRGKNEKKQNNGKKKHV